MTKDRPLKSAYELAMERLQREDRRRGEDDGRPLRSEQKKHIARLRAEAKAKLAEVEIMHRQKLAEVAGDPEKTGELEQHYRIDRRRIESALESAIARVRQGKEPNG